MLRQCEWCYSAKIGVDGKIEHLPTCCLHRLVVSEYSHIPERSYCPNCRDHFYGGHASHHRTCVYENGCTSCKAKYLDKYHAENCRKAEVWKTATLPLLPGTSALTLPLEPLEQSPIPPSFPFHGFHDDGHLVSHMKPAEASSIEAPFYQPSCVTRRAANGARWSSQFSDREWITIDLEEIYIVCKVVLDWEPAYAKEYSVQVSLDNHSWLTVFTTINGQKRIENIRIHPVRARYVRMLATKRATQWGYSLWQFQVFGKETDDGLPMTQKILKKWDKKLPCNDIIIVDERKVPWSQTSAPPAMGR